MNLPNLQYSVKRQSVLADSILVCDAGRDTGFGWTDVQKQTQADPAPWEVGAN